MNFRSRSLKHWCRHHAVRQRFGAIGKRGSIAVVERFIRTLKESMRSLTGIPLRRRLFHLEVGRAISWYNADRPHTTLKGATPDEVYAGRRPALQTTAFRTAARLATRRPLCQATGAGQRTTGNQAGTVPGIRSPTSSSSACDRRSRRVRLSVRPPWSSRVRACFHAARTPPEKASFAERELP